jgi:hypothetical protein
MAYLRSRASSSIHLDKLAGGRDANAFWINPRTGRSAANGILPTSGVREFSTPDGWEDALLVLEPPAGAREP